jgi:hypothetical protein
MITKLIQANSRNMVRKTLDCLKYVFITMTNWATIPHQGIQGGYPLIYAGCLDGNQTHAHMAQRLEPNH